MDSMGRWEPDARGRLLRAAIELFTERGYDATTTAQIAERAGLTKTTLFRHFSDKREILFQGQDTLIALAADAVRTAAPENAPFDVLRIAVLALCSIHDAEHREIGRQLEVILASSPELRERAAFKRSAIGDGLRQALAERLDDARPAGVLADIGMRAYYDGFASWVASSDDGPLADVVSSELAAYEVMLVPGAGRSSSD
jgi:AcrR family transcriptional regulator